MDGGSADAEDSRPLLDSSRPGAAGDRLVDRRAASGVGRRAGAVLPRDRLAAAWRLAEAPSDLAAKLARFAAHPGDPAAARDDAVDGRAPAAERRDRAAGRWRPWHGRAEGAAGGVDRGARAGAREPTIRDCPRGRRGRARGAGSPRTSRRRCARRCCAVGSDRGANDDVRLDALAAVPARLAGAVRELFDAAARPAWTRRSRRWCAAAAPAIVERAALSRAQLTDLAGVGRRRPGRSNCRACCGVRPDGDEALGLDARRGARQAPAPARACAPRCCKPRLAKYPASVRREAEAPARGLERRCRDARARLEELLPRRPGATSAAARRSSTARRPPASTCHAIGYIGGKVGPDLTRIGQVRTERDLLEADRLPERQLRAELRAVMVVRKAGGVPAAC